MKRAEALQRGGTCEAVPEPTDETLMAQYQAGSKAAFESLYARHKGPVYRYFTRQLRRDQADDCFQTVWLKLINASHGYRADAPFNHYLFTIAHNVLMDHHRREFRRREELMPDIESASVAGGLAGSTGDEGAQALARSRLREKLYTLLKKLPVHQREVWLLKQETDLSNREIAGLTSTSEEGVKSRLRYARGKLKAGLASYAP